MKALLLLFFLVFPLTSHAQDSVLDVTVGFGSYQLELKYLFKENPAPHDGYLLQAHDIALLKVDLDSYKQDCESLVHDASELCLRDLERCSLDADERFAFLNNENQNLLKQLDLSNERLVVQKNKTLIYTLTGVLSSVALTTTYFIFIK